MACRSPYCSVIFCHCVNRLHEPPTVFFSEVVCCSAKPGLFLPMGRRRRSNEIDSCSSAAGSHRHPEGAEARCCQRCGFDKDRATHAGFTGADLQNLMNGPPSWPRAVASRRSLRRRSLTLSERIVTGACAAASVILMLSLIASCRRMDGEVDQAVAVRAPWSQCGTGSPLHSTLQL
jgi:hypothetical protein